MVTRGLPLHFPLERTYYKLRKKEHTDDRLLYLNMYSIYLELKSEEPKTNAGRLAIKKAILNYESKLWNLYFSLKDRKML